MKIPEQIDSHEHLTGYRRWLKRARRRLLRRLWRQLGQDAPTRNFYRGYSG